MHIGHVRTYTTFIDLLTRVQAFPSLRCQDRRMRMRIPLLAAVAAALCAAGVTATDGAAAASSGPAVSTLGLETTSVRHDTATSSNWAGYVVSGLPESTSPTSFSRVSARWVQPAASCTSLRNTYPAFWVGLGGSAESSQTPARRSSIRPVKPPPAARFRRSSRRTARRSGSTGKPRLLKRLLPTSHPFLSDDW
jgi:hypothetical protein